MIEDQKIVRETRWTVGYNKIGSPTKIVDARGIEDLKKIVDQIKIRFAVREKIKDSPYEFKICSKIGD